MDAGSLGFDVAGGRVPGADHRRTGTACQDAFAWTGSAQGLVATVCDGCGSGRSSEVGASLGARLWTHALHQRLQAPAQHADTSHPATWHESIWPAVRAEVTSALDRLIQAMGGDRADVLAGAELLRRYAEPRFRRTQVSGSEVVEILSDLCQTVVRVHAAGVVIGDFNDLNVLVSGRRAYLIDADSFQYGRHACTVYSERFVDPLLCDRHAEPLTLTSPHQETSDWYAFAVLVMRGLLCVGPYGGVYRPRDAPRKVSQAARPYHRVPSRGRVSQARAALRAPAR